MQKAEQIIPLSGCHALLTFGKKTTPPGKSSVSTDGLQDYVTWTCALTVFCVIAMQTFVAQKTGCETIKLLVNDSSQALHVLVCSITSPELYVTSLAR